MDIFCTLYCIMVLPSIIGMALFLRYDNSRSSRREHVNDEGPMFFGGLSLMAGIFWPIVVPLILFFLVLYVFGSIATPAISSETKSETRLETKPETGHPLLSRTPLPPPRPRPRKKRFSEPEPEPEPVVPPVTSPVERCRQELLQLQAQVGCTRDMQKKDERGKDV